jgi:peptidyl-prolyl cis-trans isomerase A (cyclophilin A)
MVNGLKSLVVIVSAMCVALSVNAAPAANDANSPKSKKEIKKMADPNSKEAAKNAPPRVEIVTSKGTIIVELNAEKAPNTVKNFLTYVNEGFYSGTIFHRVIKGFMIQGGGMTAAGEKKTHAPIKLESKTGLKNDRGTIAMARTGNPDSATAQFFINTKNNDFLNYGVRDEGYAVFGKVVDGMKVVDAIESAKTGPGDVPTETITIISAKVLNPAK